MTNVPNWKAWRRKRAIELLIQGWNESEIAKIFGVTQSAVSQWIKLGQDAAMNEDRRGRPCQLDIRQKNMIPEFLSHGAEAYGFKGDVWTCARVAKVIYREFGIQYHRRQIGRLLKELQWTPQKPIIRATQRDESQIEEWKTRIWPALKKSLNETRKSSFFPMNPAFICFQEKHGLMRREPIQQ
jgi:transposase